MDAVHLQPQGLPEQTISGTPPLPHLLVVRPHRVERGSSAGVAPERADLSHRAKAFWLGRLHLLSFAGLSVFVVAILALHGLQDNLDPAEHTISEYSLGSYGWLMRAGFLALGVGTLATAASLRLCCGPSGWRCIGLLMLAGAATGLFLDTGFNTDHLRVPETFDGTIHGIGTWILALALPGAAFVFGSDFVRNSISTQEARFAPVPGCGTTRRRRSLRDEPDDAPGLGGAIGHCAGGGHLGVVAGALSHERTVGPTADGRPQLPKGLGLRSFARREPSRT